MNKIDFMCTAFRDGFQSCYGTRVLNKDFMPALDAAKAAGINWFEMGGGAVFQSKVFYCNEDPYKAMDEVREHVGPDANLQTLARGVNVVALDSCSSDIIKLHAQMFHKHGVTTIRNFDALNDVNNLIYSGKCIKDAGCKHQVVVTLMGLPPGLSGAHDANFYVGILRKILDAGIPFDSVCFKDASGTTPQSIVYQTVSAARKLLGKDAYIDFHSHETANGCIAQYLAAIIAGANAVDLSLSPVSGGTSQPDVLSMWHNLRGTPYTLDIDIDKVREAEHIFEECMSTYFKPPESDKVSPLIPFSPMPGGALTANTQMLRDNKLMDKYGDCIVAMGETVAKGGFGTSVTPVSQFYFQQAFNNVMFGKWKKIAPGYGKMVLGYFGKTPCPPDPEVIKIASEQLGLQPVTKTVLELNDADESKSRKHFEDMLKEAGLPTTDENVFLVASCAEKGIAFLKGEAKTNIRKVDPNASKLPATTSAKSAVTVNLDGKKYDVRMENGTVTVNGKSYSYSLGDAPVAPAKSTSSSGGGAKGAVKAPLAGLVLRLPTKPGDSVESGKPIMIIEAMKMEMEIKAPRDCKVVSIEVKQGDQLAADQVLAYIE